jgi:hypothetical protein
VSRQNSCGWCISIEGTRWDALLADGMPLAAVSALTPFSASVGLAHARDHVAPRSPEPIRLTGSTNPMTVEEFAKQLTAIAVTTAAQADLAESSGDPQAMLSALESKAEVANMLAAALNLMPDVAESLVSETEATVRGSHRLTLSGLPTDPETLAWFIREAGGHQVADAIEESARKEWSA